MKTEDADARSERMVEDRGREGERRRSGQGLGPKEEMVVVGDAEEDEGFKRTKARRGKRKNGVSTSKRKGRQQWPSRDDENQEGKARHHVLLLMRRGRGSCNCLATTTPSHKLWWRHCSCSPCAYTKKMAVGRAIGPIVHHPSL